MDRQRSPRNRTITLSPSERAALERRLVTADGADAISTDNSLIFGDIVNVLPALPAQFADLIIADPPYNLTKDFGGRTFRASSDEAYAEYLHSWLPAVMRCLKPGGSIYVCCDWRSSAAVYNTLREVACVKNRITWQREKGRGAAANWKNSMEDIWFAVADERNYYFNVDAVKQRRRVIAPYRSNGVPKDWEETDEGRFRLTCPSNFWDDISVPYWSMPENTDHPTQKPEKLIAKLVLASCPPEGMVFDPFLGSGTTAVVAAKLGRRYCGVEINKEYLLLAAKRLERAQTDTAIQGYSDGIFWERNASLHRKHNHGDIGVEK